MAPSLAKLKTTIAKKADPKRAAAAQRYFKTGKGEYGEGDVFLGLAVPVMRTIAKDFKNLPWQDALKLLKSKIHEERFVALLLLVKNYKQGDEKTQRAIFEQYLKHAKWINNWDLVDTSAPQIVGDFCWRMKNAKLLKQLAHSRNLWEKRIGVLATFTFIRQGETGLTLQLAKILLNDKHDLIHKAVGWMLREAEPRDKRGVRAFLEAYAAQMPRTMLRYAIEKFNPGERKKYLEIKGVGKNK